MLSIFRSNQLLWSILLIPYAAVLRLSVFLFEDGWEPASTGILSDWIYQWIGFTGVIPDSAAILLLFLQGALLNDMNADHRFADQVSLFPGLFYVMLCSMFPDFLHLSPLLMANTFYMLALTDLMAVYNRQQSAGYIFNAGLWIGIGSLFFFSYAVFILLAFVALNILRAFNFRERLMVLTGAVVPYLLTGLYYFWTDQWTGFLEQQIYENVAWLDFPSGRLNWRTYLKLGAFTLPLLTVLFSHNFYVSKKIIQERKKINILYWGMLISILILLFQSGVQIELLLILSVPLALLWSINLVNLPNNWAELIHLFFFLIIMILQYQPHLFPDLAN